MDDLRDRFLYPTLTLMMDSYIIMLKNVKMPLTIVGIVTFISMINKSIENLNAKNIFIFQNCIFMSS